MESLSLETREKTNGTSSVQWKEPVIEHIMLRHIPPDHDVLEIGPGSGRLDPRTGRNIATPHRCRCGREMHHLVQGSTRETETTLVYVNDGRSLDVLSDKSILCVGHLTSSCM